MENPEIAIRRLFHQRIAWSKEATPEKVVQRLGALQAQDYGQAIWGIGLRAQDAKAADVERAIADKKIVLSWAMRGTLHFVPAADVRWMLRLLTPRILSQSKRRKEQLEIDEALIARSEALIRGVLQDREWIDRPGLMQLFEDEGISTANQRGYHLLWHLAQQGVICLGPIEEKKQTVVLLDEWVRSDLKLSADESLAEIALRYFTSHGPATLHDFAWWTGLTIGEAKRGLENAKGALASELFDGTEYWMSKDQAEDNKKSSDVYLLPGFDEYLLGYTNRSAVLAATHAPKIIPGNNGVFMPMLVLDGQVAGTWKRTIKKNRVEIAIHSFEGLDHRRGLVIEAAERYGEFLGLPVSQIVIEEGV